MAEQTQPATAIAGSDRLILLTKSAYWVALGIIAAMTLASYLLLQSKMSEQQHDGRLLTLATTQKALSQRIIYLANAAQAAEPGKRPPLLFSLREANGEFERNHELLLQEMGTVRSGATRSPGTVDRILFSAPYHLDHFATGLASSGWRFVTSFEREVEGRSGSVRETPPPRLDEIVANATLSGYDALAKQFDEAAGERLDGTLTLHDMLFYATIGVIVLVALFIFRPMSKLVLRKTQELVEARNSMAFIAVHDGLTGLHNRAFLNDQFGALINAAARRTERLAVLQLDLDRFKQINDTLGHAAGDYVLVVTAQRMRESCRASDLCVRLGGDEFVMILSGAGSSEDIATLARRILDKINQPITFQGATIQPGASAGIAVYPVDADTAGDLIVHADLALYSAKKLGGGNFSFFSDELRQELEHRKQLERELKLAIANDTFGVYFQPQVSLSNGEITGVEALVRWPHAERGMISPAEFIPVAEKAGLMVDVGRIIMRKAIAEAAGWYDAGMSFGRLAINISGTELREDDFEDFLFGLMAKAGLPLDKLSLEIVESVILDDEKTGIASKLRRIRAQGIHLELDDFGTGYASLSHINPNEIDRLKIDRRFVQKIHLNNDNSKIVRAITELARGLGISIIAEGAETEDELNSLLSIGCDQVQGYSIALPMPDAQARDWLAARMPKRAQLKVVEGARA
ncbi:MAG: putative bifunctional diguanylate cyclase/phosphodiesterase [Rhizobiaceae bacterium]